MFLKRTWKFGGIVAGSLMIFLLFLREEDSQISTIDSQMLANSIWKMPLLKEEELERLDFILNQPFTYLGEGGQSTVYTSKDQHFVLKLFKFNRFRPSFFARFLPNSFREKHLQKKEKKMFSVLAGHKLAFEALRTESALILVQINSLSSPRWVTLIDKKGFETKVNLEHIPHVLQEKGDMIQTVFSQLLTNGNIETVKQRIGQLLSLCLLEYQKGICDRDHGIMHNMGCIDDKVFHLDVGKLIRNSTINSSLELKRVASKIQIWIDQHYPQYSNEVSRYLSTRLETFNYE